jgi:hypothetical protein
VRKIHRIKTERERERERNRDRYISLSLSLSLPPFLSLSPSLYLPLQQITKIVNFSTGPPGLQI